MKGWNIYVGIVVNSKEKEDYGRERPTMNSCRSNFIEEEPCIVSLMHLESQYMPITASALNAEVNAWTDVQYQNQKKKKKETMVGTLSESREHQELSSLRGSNLSMMISLRLTSCVSNL